MTTRRTSPELAARIEEHAVARTFCRQCAAQPGQPCTGAPPGKAVHGIRWERAAMTYRQAGLRSSANTVQGNAHRPEEPMTGGTRAGNDSRSRPHGDLSRRTGGTP